MSNRPWKQHERDSAELIDGKRFPANMGHRLDVESPWAVGQCKHVKSLSLMKLTRLAEEMNRRGQADRKLGLVFTKIRMGAGRPASRIVTMHEEQWLLVRSLIRQLRAKGEALPHGVLIDGAAVDPGEVCDQDRQ